MNDSTSLLFAKRLAKSYGVKPCPKCGNKYPSMRMDIYRVDSSAVCCGKENCRFYISARTDKEAVEAWNKYYEK